MMESRWLETLSDTQEEREGMQTSNLTDAQQIALSIIPIVSCLFSIVGSGLIIYMVHAQSIQTKRGGASRSATPNSRTSLSSHHQSNSLARPSFSTLVSPSSALSGGTADEPNKVRWTPYQRIMVAMSVCDILISFAFPWFSLLVPSSSEQSSADSISNTRVWAIGNQATCTAVGFLNQLAFASPLYAASLSWFFLLSIRFGKSNETIAKRYEPWMHATSLGFPLVTAILGAAFDVYNEMEVGRGCWVTSPLLATLAGGLPFLICMLSVWANHYRIVSHVRHTTQHARRHSTLVSSMGPDTQTRRVQAVATQAAFYVAAFCITYVSVFILRILESAISSHADQRQSTFVVQLFQSVLFPMNGFFNFLVFVRPKYLQARRQVASDAMSRLSWTAGADSGDAQRKGGRCWALRCAVFGSPNDVGGGRRRRRRSTYAAGNAADGDTNANANRDVTKVRNHLDSSILREIAADVASDDHFTTSLMDDEHNLDTPATRISSGEMRFVGNSDTGSVDHHAHELDYQWQMQSPSRANESRDEADGVFIEPSAAAAGSEAEDVNASSQQHQQQQQPPAVADPAAANEAVSLKMEDEGSVAS